MKKSSVKKGYPSVFHLVSSEFSKSRLSYVLIGGFAVNHYGVSRQTADVDFLIAEDKSSLAADLLKQNGYKQAVSKEIFARFESNKSYLMDIDLLFVDKETLTGIIKDGKKITIAGKKFIVPSLKHLIALKLHSIRSNPGARELRDLPDIINLIKMNKLSTKTAHFRALCLKYGTKELYNNILNTLKRSMS